LCLTILGVVVKWRAILLGDSVVGLPNNIGDHYGLDSA
jgi:hypothetical protein